MSSTSHDLTDRFLDFYEQYYRDEIGQLAQHYPNEQRSLYIDYDDLYRFDPDLAEDYRHQPGQLREYAEEALQLFDLPADIKLENAHVRLENLPETVDIRQIRVHDDHVESLIAVQGIARKVTDVRPKITHSAFECQRCGTHNHVEQVDGDFGEPHECAGCERQGPFEINFDQSEFVDAQKIRIQESPEGLRGGETPQHIDMHIEDDITGEVTPGDHITAVGILHIEQQTSGNEKTPLFEHYLEGVSLTVEDEDFTSLDIDDGDIERISELASSPDIYDRMVDSIAPSIFGYEDEKLAMVLQLFSGVTKHLPDGSRIRGDFHMLLIGDPGTAKSKIVSYITNLAPRSVYTSGKGSSSAGLTASAVKDDFGEGQQWTLEAGALVLADMGIAAVDELDKLDETDQSAMHEALEQQQISISKAGINATLQSRCSLLAAANPKYGRFDQHEPVNQQITLDPALMSRFDLIFTVTDTPDRQRDSDLADHILETNYAGEVQTHRQQNTTPTVDQGAASEASEQVEPEIEGELIRKYVAHAQQTCFPAMTEEARSMIREFYVDLRAKGAEESDPIPVTARKLEAIVRLAEASARVRLSNTVTEADADRAISIIRSSIEDVGIDPETGELDADVVEADTSKSQRDRIKGIKDIIKEIAQEYDEGAPEAEVVKRATENGMDASKAEKELDKLRRKGEVYNPSGEYLQVT